ncbi:MAG: T9SS type A sorting domain-containing protein [candidate division WOR-3 bacterium]
MNHYELVFADTGPVYPDPPGIHTGNFKPNDVGDIDQDGLTDLLGPNWERANESTYNVVTTQESPDYHSYPESLSWWYRFAYNEVISEPFYFTTDLDNDTKKEILAGVPNIQIGAGIWENVANNQNELVWHRATEDGWAFSFYDFDMDGRKEFVTVGLGSLGRAFIYENTGDNQYELIRVDTVRIPNGSDVFSGNDLDSDGKPEFFVGFAQWVGGNIWDFYLYMWEATGNNTYERTFIERVRDVDWLDKRSKCGDIDGDGREELVWSIGAQVRVYKATGNNQFQLVWSWRNDHGGDYPHSLVNIYDMNRNGYQEIVVSGWNKTSIFEVEAVKLLRPNGGERLLGNSQEVIKWQTFYPPRCDSLSLFFSSDNGRNYELIATGIPGADTSYLWTVPNISSDSCKIRIIAYGPGWQYDESDGVFSITQTGIEEPFSLTKPFKFEISPNPAKGNIKIRYSLPEEAKIKIYDILGKQTKDFSLPRTRNLEIIKLEDSHFPLDPGVYILRLETKRKTFTHKFVWIR